MVAEASASGYPRELVQPSLLRMRDWQIRPDHALGQCFLVDSNVLALISDAAELAPDSVVLEVGGGLGVLSEHLACSVGHLHVIEVDRRLEGPLLQAVAGFANVTVHWGDALKIDLGALSPAPQALVANLPYGIAAQLLLRSVFELPGLDSWVAMVQREVGERLAATPAGGRRASGKRSGREYGATSVLVQLACDVRIVRPISRQVFRPVPRVDSVLLAMKRREQSPSRQLRDFVHAAFAHRRKSLVRSLSLAAGEVAVDREQIVAALAVIGHPADVRAERLSPQELRTLEQIVSS